MAFAFEKEEDDKLFARWVGLAQYDVSFEEFKRRLMPVVIDEQKTMEELDVLMDSTKWRKEEIYGDI